MVKFVTWDPSPETAAGPNLVNLEFNGTPRVSVISAEFGGRPAWLGWAGIAAVDFKPAQAE